MSTIIECFILLDSTVIIAEVVEDIDVNLAEIKTYIKNPSEVVDEPSGKTMYAWPIVESDTGIYPIPNHVMRYIPDQEAVRCYTGAFKSEQNSALN